MLFDKNESYTHSHNANTQYRRKKYRGNIEEKMFCSIWINVKINKIAANALEENRE